MPRSVERQPSINQAARHGHALPNNYYCTKFVVLEALQRSDHVVSSRRGRRGVRRAPARRMHRVSILRRLHLALSAYACRRCGEGNFAIALILHSNSQTISGSDYTRNKPSSKTGWKFREKIGTKTPKLLAKHGSRKQPGKHRPANARHASRRLYARIPGANSLNKKYQYF